MTAIATNAGSTGAAPRGGAGGRLDFIDALRGLAILLVVAFHTWLIGGAPFPYWWNPIAHGFTGVHLFLVLSGFCLYWPFVSRGLAAVEPTLWQFAKRRARRLIPPYYASLAICATGAMLFEACGRTWPGAHAGGVPAIARTVVWHALLVHNLRPEHVGALNGPFWSLALEASFYLAMPLLVEIARRRGIATAVAISLAVSMSYRIAMDRVFGGNAGWLALGNDRAFVVCYFLPGRWFEFALGMWGAVLVARRQVRLPGVALGAASLAFLIAGALVQQRWGGFAPTADAIYGVGYFLLLLAASEAATPRFRAAPARNMVALGVISYSIYLVHLPFLELTRLVLEHWGLRVRYIMGGLVLTAVPLSLAFAYFFHVLIERPFMNKAAVGGPLRPQSRTRASDAIPLLAVSEATAVSK